MQTWMRQLTNEKGSILMMAILAMLILAVIGLSFVVLANLETRIGINHKEGVQAFARAEAGLDHGRDRARAIAAAGPFPGTFNDVNLVGNAAGASMLLTDVPYPDGGSYSVRIDNDCAGVVPAAMADPGCPNDTNGRAVLTAWTGLSDKGRARIRVWVEMDDVWEHVCASDDDPCYTQNGNPVVTPSDPSEPGGPATFPQLPNPLLGDHARRTACAPSLGSTLVMPAYFDFAVRRTCPAGICSPPDFPNPPGGTNRNGWDPDPASPTYNPNGCGMVVDGTWTPDGTPANPLHVNQTGAPGGGPVVVYVTGKANIKGPTHIQGTIVAHGDSDSSTKDIRLQPDVCLNRLSSGPNCGAPNSAVFKTGQGYPLAILLYNPAQPAPQPAQNVLADISDPNVFVSGIIYSGGSAEFNPINLDGGVVAYNVTFQASSSAMTYNATYGDDAPPPGFTTPAGASTAAPLRRTWKACATYFNDNNPAIAPNACD